MKMKHIYNKFTDEIVNDYIEYMKYNDLPSQISIDSLDLPHIIGKIQHQQKETERLKEQLSDEIDEELKQSEIMVKKQQEIERLNKLKERYQLEKEMYKTRNEKAIEYLESFNTDFKNCRFGEAPISIRELGDLLDILRGEDK